MRRCALFIAFGAALGTCAAWAQESTQGHLQPPPAARTSTADTALTREILPRLGRVAQLYRDTALRFTCKEEITDTGLGGHKFQFEYIYIYDKTSGFQDHRTHLVRGQIDRIDPEKAGARHFVQRAYSWAFIFSEAEQRLHRYEMAGKDTVLDRPAIKVDFVPIPPYRAGVNEWFGTAWVDAESYQLLRVEAMRSEAYRVNQRFQENLAVAITQATRLRPEQYVIERVSTDFTEQKNGMRFPGRVVIANSVYQIQGGSVMNGFLETPLYRVQQTYSDYNFFAVHTEQDLRNFVLGEGQPAKSARP
jgi:hypothetical protein